MPGCSPITGAALPVACFASRLRRVVSHCPATCYMEETFLIFCRMNRLFSHCGMADFPSLQDIRTKPGRDVGEDARISGTWMGSTSRSWKKTPAWRKQESIRKALVFQRRLESASIKLQLLLSEANPAHCADPERLQQSVDDIASSTGGLHDFLSDMVVTRLFNERRGANAQPAQQVFNVPELLERVLSFISARELLSVQTLNRTFYNMIECSGLLQQRLGLKALKDSSMASPFQGIFRHPLHVNFSSPFPMFEFPALELHHRPLSQDIEALPGEGKETLPRNTIALVVKSSFAPKGEPRFRIGSKCRSIPICQPPVHQMYAYPSCCTQCPFIDERGVVERPLDAVSPMPFFMHPAWTPQQPLPSPPDWPRLQPIQTVTSVKGITVGDLFDATLRIAAAHKLCPFAEDRAHDFKGNVCSDVLFACQMSLEKGDPALERLGTWQPNEYVPPQSLFRLLSPFDWGDDEEHEARRRELNTYILAKQRGEFRALMSKKLFRVADDGVYIAVLDGRPIPTFAEYTASQEVVESDETEETA